MKIKILIITIVTLAYSCKKGYICSCSTVYTFELTGGGTDNRTFPSDAVPYNTWLTKKQAISACDNQGGAIRTDFTNGITNKGATPLKSDESIVTKCIVY